MGAYIPLIITIVLFITGIIWMLVWRARVNKVASHKWIAQQAAIHVVEAVEKGNT